MPLLVPVIAILMLLMIAPCIIDCLTRFFSAQVNKVQRAVPGYIKGYIKLQLTRENIIHLWLDTDIRSLSLKTSKRGLPNAPLLSQFSRK